MQSSAPHDAPALFVAHGKHNDWQPRDYRDVFGADRHVRIRPGDGAGARTEHRRELRKLSRHERRKHPADAATRRRSEGRARQPDAGIQIRQARGDDHASARQRLYRRAARVGGDVVREAANPREIGDVMDMQRRDFLRMAGAFGAMATLGGCASPGGGSLKGKIVVVGGGYGGATAAKYLALWSGGAADVTLVEADAAFISCPLSNLVLGGSRELADLTVGYDGLAKRGVTLVRGTAIAVDSDKRVVRLEQGATLPYDRLVLSPGVDFVYSGVPGLSSASAQARVLHAWKAGAQTLLLRRQLETMADGGVFAIVGPRA